jgi:hypothetical protein
MLSNYKAKVPSKKFLGKATSENLIKKEETI